MKILCRSATVLSLIFLCLQFTPCYAANEAFHGTYRGELGIVNEEGNILFVDFSFTFARTFTSFFTPASHPIERVLLSMVHANQVETRASSSPPI